MGRVVLKQPSLNIVAGTAATGRDCAAGAAEAALVVASVVRRAKTAPATSRARVLIRDDFFKAVSMRRTIAYGNGHPMGKRPATRGLVRRPWPGAGGTAAGAGTRAR